MKFFLTLAMLCANVAVGQVFTVTEAVPAQIGAAGPRPLIGSLAAVDGGAAALLKTAPQEELGRRLSDYGLRVSLPTPAGELEQFVVAESSVMAPELQAKFPDIRTFIVQSLVRPEVTGRLEISQRGVTAMLRTSRGAWFIDPWQSMDSVHHVSYYLSDLPGGNDWKCETPVDLEAVKEEGEEQIVPQVLGTLRSYRIAMACTGEYGAYHCQIQGHAPNVADPLAAIVTLVSRSNVVYEADMAIRFTLIANNDLLIFLDGATDPYTSTCGGGGGTDCSGTILTENTGAINSRVGSGSYDIGHCVTRIFGGVANLRAVCTNNKAGGVSGIPRGGDVDPFSALVVIHEIGHQFGANHTFSGVRGRCAGNVNLSTAWEAGTGSSPMGYAGGCPVGDAPPSDNIQLFADPFFHHGSVVEMKAFLATGGHTCPIQTTTTNNAPVVVSVTPASIVPPNTPFVLTGDASDQDGDVLTYSWEQYDSGVARAISGDGVSDNGRGALFRIFPPVVSKDRTFPRMADVLSGVATPGEMLPSTTGFTRRFRMIVRDNAPGAGNTVISPFVNVEIASGSSQFAVTSPTLGAVRRFGAATVLWSVGGTNSAPISTSSVVIKLSLDDGATFPISLATAPNTGSAAVTLPSFSSTNARIKIESQGNIFFAVSQPFTIESLCQAVDFNNDSVVDFFDYLDFADAFSTNGPGADFNLDGTIDFFDYLDFVDAFAQAC